ncbi:MAG: aldo/keto reductase [Bacillota bacterium]|jgi:aryl-alcohol dehydrogenase-like predicted oxidoreductase
MQQRRLGPGAAEVGAVGYGGMHLSIAERPPEEQGIRAIHAALDAGVTLIDTADVYCLDTGDLGHNERLIARALREWRGDRDRVVIATKGGMTRPGGRWERDGRPAHLREACERSLRALGVDCIALYQLHAPDPAVPFEESVGALARLREAGKVRWVGLSNVTESQIAAAQRLVPITSVQNRLNPFFQEALTDGVLRACADHGLGFLAYSPTGGGRLNRKLPDHPVVGAVARRRDASPHAVVIAWVLSRSPVVIPIPSARTPAHAADAASAADLQLTDADLAELSRAAYSRA